MILHRTMIVQRSPLEPTSPFGPYCNRGWTIRGPISRANKGDTINLYQFPSSSSLEKIKILQAGRKPTCALKIWVCISCHSRLAVIAAFSSGSKQWAASSSTRRLIIPDDNLHFYCPGFRLRRVRGLIIRVATIYSDFLFFRQEPRELIYCRVCFLPRSRLMLIRTRLFEFNRLRGLVSSHTQRSATDRWE